MPSTMLFMRRLWVLASSATLSLAVGCSGAGDTTGQGGDASTSAATTTTTATGMGGGGGATGAGGGATTGAGCTPPADARSCGDCPIAVSFANDVQPIFTTSCAKSSCHSSASAKENLVLKAGTSFGEIVGGPTSQCNGDRTLVVPGDPANSYVLDKILDVDTCEGKRMPPSGAALSAAKIQLISDWICAGALDN